MLYNKKIKSLIDTEKKVIEIAEKDNLKSGDYFYSDLDLKLKMGISLNLVHETLTILKTKGIIFQDENKKNRIGSMYRVLHEESKIKEKYMKNTFTLPTSNVVPESIVKKYDIFKDFSNKRNYFGFVNLYYENNRNTIPLYYEIRWLNTNILKNFNSNMLTNDDFIFKVKKSISENRFNTIEEIHIEKIARSDMNIFKFKEDVKYIPTVYKVDYDYNGNVISIAIKKYQPNNFKFITHDSRNSIL